MPALEIPSLKCLARASEISSHESLPFLSVSISSNVSFATVACLSFSIATAAFLLLAPAPIVKVNARDHEPPGPERDAGLTEI